MSVQNFKPEIFSTLTLTARDERAVALPICDRSFEGDFKGGDRVHIPGVGTPTTHDLPASGLFQDAGGNPIAAETVEDEDAEFIIDQRKFILYRTSDVDKLQMNQAALQRFQYNYGNQMVKEQDSYIYGLAKSGAGFLYDKSAVSGGMTSQNAFGFICDALSMLYSAHSALTPGDVSIEVHPYVANVIAKAMDFHGTPNDLKNGETGNNVNGVKVLISNNTITTDSGGTVLTSAPKMTDANFATYKFHGVIRTKRAIVFAEPKQMSFTAGDLATQGVGEYVKGWYFYGGKVLYPDEVVDIVFSLGTDINL